MFVAVAVASLGTTSLQRTKAAAPPVSTLVKYKTPAMLALKTGDASVIGSSTATVFILLSPYCESGRSCRGNHPPDYRVTEKFDGYHPVVWYETDKPNNKQTENHRTQKATTRKK